MLPYPQGFAFLDVETTGLYAKDRLVEIAIVRTDFELGVVSEMTTLLNPGRDVGPTTIHGITASDVVHAPSFEEILGEVVKHLAGAVLVGHNVQFDVGMITQEFVRAGIQIPAVPALCTLHLADHFLPGLSSRRLGDCCKVAGLRQGDAHCALEDARATKELFAHYTRLAISRCAAPWDNECRMAWAVAWPKVDQASTARMLTREANASRQNTEQSYLGKLIASLPPTDLPPSMQTYFSALDQILEDRTVTADEAAKVAEIARQLGLSAERVAAAHKVYLTDLARAALADGVVTELESEDILRVTRLLGLNDVDLQNAMSCAHKPAATVIGLDRPISAGMTVCFTGDSAISREELERRARRAELRVTNGMSKKVDILVVADSASTSTKAQRARELGVRVVAVPAFLLLMDRMPPAGDKAVVSEAQRAEAPSHEMLKIRKIEDLRGRRVLVIGATRESGAGIEAVIESEGAVIAKRLTKAVQVIVTEKQTMDEETLAGAREGGCAVVSQHELEAMRSQTPAQAERGPATPAQAERVPATPAQAERVPATPTVDHTESLPQQALAHAEAAISQQALSRSGAKTMIGYQSLAHGARQEPARQYQTPASAVPPPGWYADPWRVAAIRWWDGRQWTGHLANQT